MLRRCKRGARDLETRRGHDELPTLFRGGDCPGRSGLRWPRRHPHSGLSPVLAKQNKKALNLQRPDKNVHTKEVSEIEGKFRIANHTHIVYTGTGATTLITKTD